MCTRSDGNLCAGINHPESVVTVAAAAFAEPKKIMRITTVAILGGLFQHLRANPRYMYVPGIRSTVRSRLFERTITRIDNCSNEQLFEKPTVPK